MATLGYVAKKNVMKKFFILFVFCLLSALNISAQNMVDAVYLKNGSVIKGSILEQVPGVSLKIQTKDGNLFVYKMDEVSKIAKEIDTNGYGNNQNRYNNNQNGYNNAPNGYNQNDNYTVQEINDRPSKKYPFLAAGLSLLVPGVGQFYNGQVGKGIGFLALSTAGIVAIEVGSANGVDEAMYAGAGAVLVSGIWSVIDAAVSAGILNNRNGFSALRVGKNQYFGIKPDLTFTTSNPFSNSKVLDPHYGLKMQYSF